VAGAVVAATLSVLLPFKLGWTLPKNLVLWSAHRNFPVKTWKGDSKDELAWKDEDFLEDMEYSPGWLLRAKTADGSLNWDL